jgi:hypothetical protein
VDDRLAVYRAGIRFTWVNRGAAFHTRECQISVDFQLATRGSLNVLGLERQQCAVARVRNVASRQVALRSERVRPVLIRRIDSQIEDRLVQIVIVDLADSDDEEVAEAADEAMAEAEIASGEEDDDEEDQWIN